MSKLSTKVPRSKPEDLGEKYLEIVRKRRKRIGDRAHRYTLRKELIPGVLKSLGTRGCMLTEELRWHVFRLEQLMKGRVATKMTRSYRHSFSRTIRGLSGPEPLIRCAALAEPCDIPAGLLARAAAFRVGDSIILDQLFAHDSLAVHLARETGTRPGRAESEGYWTPIASIRVGFAMHSLTRLLGVFDYSVRIPVNRPIRVVALSQLDLATVTQLGLLPKGWSLILDGYAQPYRIEWHHRPSWMFLEIEPRYRCWFDRPLVRHGHRHGEFFASPPQWTAYENI